MDVNGGVKSRNGAIEDPFLVTQRVQRKGTDVLSVFEETIFLINRSPDPAGGLSPIPCVQHARQMTGLSTP